MKTNFLIGMLKKLGLIRTEPSIEDYRRRGVVIGENVHLYSCDIDEGHGFLVSIGNNVTMTHTTVRAHDASVKMELGFSKVGKVKIGNNVFIGHGSIILGGVTIGDDVIIGAGSVVRYSIPGNSLAMGNPAAVVCSKTAYIEKNRERLQQAPVYHTYWEEKTQEEKSKMIEELEDKKGYDI